MSNMQEKTPPKAGLAHITKVVNRTRIVLWWERIWPPVFAVILLALTFLTVSWFGFWSLVPPVGKMIALAGIAVVYILLLWRLVKVKFPQTEDAIQRIESISGVQHRPLTASLDIPANKNVDPSTPQGALWQAHQRRIAENLAKLRSGWPTSQISIRDPYALRTIVLLAAFIGFNVAGPDRLARLGDAFDFSTTRAAPLTRLDAWVTPPRYTAKPPIFLTKDTLTPDQQTIIVPTGSEITIRTVNTPNAIITFTPGKGEAVAISANSDTDQENADPVQRSNQSDYKFQLSENGTVAIESITRNRQWAFTILEDSAPEISFAENPEVQQSGALQIIAKLSDDYGIIHAEASIKPTEFDAGDENTRPLYDAPEFPLSLNRGRVKDGTSETLRSIVDHPWAGAEIEMILHAFDEAGQEGASKPITFKLPLRRFTKPLARALVEQRRNLAMDANYALTLTDIIDVITIRPEQFDENLGVFIALASIKRGLLDARDDDDLRQVVDDLWDLAVGLEDGNLSDAERALKDALEALREGIKNGASQEELARLMDQARQAMQEFMQALAEQAQRNNQNAQNDQNPQDPSRVLRPDDLQKMLDRIEELAQTGSKDAAQQLLSELQQMMENLQANRQQQGQQGQNQAQQMLNELGDMIRRQQQLMDQTFRQQQPNSNNNQQQGKEPGQQSGSNNGQSPQGLQQGQGDLADRLQRFLDQHGGQSSDPNGQLGEAGRSMRGAADNLGQGNLPGAGEQQADALSQLRRGAQAFAEQMAGEGEGEGNHDLARGDRRTDPLGRREGRVGSDFGDDVKVPDEIDTQRAREILDAIRRRLGEAVRPQIELDYLERLLRSDQNAQ